MPRRRSKRKNRRTLRLALAAPLAAIVVACGAAGEDASDGSGEDARSVDGLEVETLAEGLDTPWEVAFAPDGRVLVTERPGRIRVLEDDELREEPYAELPAEETGEGGQQHDPLGPAQGAVRQQGKEERPGRDHKRHLAPQGAPPRPKGTDQRHRTQNQPQVGDVRTHDVPEGRPGGIAEARNERGRKLRRGGGEGHHREADRERAHPRRARQADGAPHEHLPARVQQPHPGEHEQGRHRPTPRTGARPSWGISAVAALPR